MATNQTATMPAGLGFNLRPLLLLLGVAAAVAVGVSVVLWWKGPNWAMLYGNLSDSDSSAVVQSLQTAGIEYKLDSSTGQVMVPAERVHDARLQLAGQGLPAGKNSSLEMITKDPGFGVSQFMENARYQLALEGELASTISSLQAVSAARVHLALPQQSAFISEHRPASASVLLQLRAGHSLEPDQVSAIVHLVASSVPELDSDQVTVVDERGRLLSAPKNSEAAIAAEQYEAEHRLEDGYIDHIEQLIAPLVGEGRVRAQVTVDLDASATEQAQEQYKPDSAIVRSEQNSEETSRAAGGASGGVPGALTNQPPAGGVAVAQKNPKPATPAAGAAGANGSAPGATAAATDTTTGTPENESKQSTKNYEIDRTVSYSKQPAGRIKRVTVAVLVDNVHKVGDGGKVTTQPLTTGQIDDITRLVKNAVGYDESRGDSVNVVNAAFLETNTEDTLTPEATPLWQKPWVRDVTRLVLGAMVLIALALGVLRPLIKNLSVSAPAVSHAPALAAPQDEGEQASPAQQASQQLAYEQQIVQARTLVTQDPKRVANVVKTWVAEQ